MNQNGNDNRKNAEKEQGVSKLHDIYFGRENRNLRCNGQNSD